MRIAILTLPLHTNYGGILQAWALQTVLQKNGHEVTVIHKSRRNVDIQPSILDYVKVFIKKFILLKKVSLNVKKTWIEAYEKRIEEDAIVRQNTWKFITKHFNLLEIDSFSEIEENAFDAFIVGSDQIWRALYIDNTLCSIPENAFLSFAKDWKIKRISYAASFGIDYWEFKKKDTGKIKNLIKLFDAVSVRESSGIDLCKDYICFEKAVQMPDPTLLLKQVDYETLILDTPPSSGNLHCYVLDETEGKKQFISRLASELNLTPVFTNSKTDDWSYPIEERIQPPLESWLRAFKDAEFVITDSFHACVFSILFKKQFVVIGNSKRGMARFQSLLSSLGINDILIENVGTFTMSDYKPIDYDVVEEKLQSLRPMAYHFLSSNLQP